MVNFRKKSVQFSLIGLAVLSIFLIYSEHSHSQAKKLPVGIYYIFNHTDSKLTLNGEDNWQNVSCQSGNVIEPGKALICKIELTKLTDKINSSFVLKSPDDYEPVLEFEGQLYLEEGGASMGGRMLQGAAYYAVKIRNRGRNPMAKTMQFFENKAAFEDDQNSPPDDEEADIKPQNKKRKK